MGVSGVAGLAPKAEVDVILLSHTGESFEDGFGAFFAEFGSVHLALVYADFGRGRVEVEGEPCCGEGVVGAGVRGFVGGDAAF